MLWNGGKWPSWGIVSEEFTQLAGAKNSPLVWHRHLGISLWQAMAMENRSFISVINPKISLLEIKMSKRIVQFKPRLRDGVPMCSHFCQLWTSRFITACLIPPHVSLAQLGATAHLLTPGTPLFMSWSNPGLAMPGISKYVCIYIYMYMYIYISMSSTLRIFPQPIPSCRNPIWRHDTSIGLPFMANRCFDVGVRDRERKRCSNCSIIFDPTWQWNIIDHRKWTAHSVDDRQMPTGTTSPSPDRPGLVQSNHFSLIAARQGDNQLGQLHPKVQGQLLRAMLCHGCHGCHAKCREPMGKKERMSKAKRRVQPMCVWWRVWVCR